MLFIHGRIGNHDGFVLRLVGAPFLVLLEQRAEVFAPDRAVQRADHLNIERRGLLEDSLHLNAVLADDVGVIAACVVHPDVVERDLVIENIACQRTERAECVRREQDLVFFVVGDHDFRPVYHRRENEMQGMLAGGELVAFLDDERAVGNIEVVELREHLRRLCGADQLGLRVAAHDRVDHRAVVRLHMLHDHVIERAAVQRVDNVFDILAADGLVRRIHQHGLVIEQDIAVVGHTARNREKVFKSAQAAVAAANINEIFLDLSGTVHRTTPPCFFTNEIVAYFCASVQWSS